MTVSSRDAFTEALYDLSASRGAESGVRGAFSEVLSIEGLLGGGCTEKVSTVEDVAVDSDQRRLFLRRGCVWRRVWYIRVVKWLAEEIAISSHQSLKVSRSSMHSICRCLVARRCYKVQCKDVKSLWRFH